MKLIVKKGESQINGSELCIYDEKGEMLPQVTNIEIKSPANEATKLVVEFYLIKNGDITIQY